MQQIDEYEELQKRARKEKGRIKRLLKAAEVAPERIKLLEPVIDNTAWMKAKLEDSRDRIRNGQIVTTYNNGGGQKGIRENPLFKGYESLFKSYMAGMNKIMETVQDKQKTPPPDIQPQTVLEAILQKRADAE